MLNKDKLADLKMDFNDILWMSSGVAIILLLLALANFFILA
ncbi:MULTISPECIES: hypothetical protein [Rossellomorea]|uniref:Uncharacterized protein n=1 Tax=Rossellomorea aquimaris TaxID=189382 RepID=A0A366EWJ9_9BACI|nr:MULTISPECIES: hypothetical protein [Rossellomorea]RBP06080.1 hypothetical protein DET59_103209 [Rossellomorea aquimaris]